MSIEFISAKDLPTTETEEIDVLCVENGELKRKAAKGLGGGGGYLLKPTAEECTVVDTTFICTTNYDEMAKAIESGGHVTIVIPAGVFGVAVPAVAIIPTAWKYIEGQGLMCICWCEDLFTIVFTNGTYVPNLE